MFMLYANDTIIMKETKKGTFICKEKHWVCLLRTVTNGSYTCLVVKCFIDDAKNSFCSLTKHSTTKGLTVKVIFFCGLGF